MACTLPLLIPRGKSGEKCDVGVITSGRVSSHLDSTKRMQRKRRRERKGDQAEEQAFGEVVELEVEVVQFHGDPNPTDSDPGYEVTWGTTVGISGPFERIAKNIIAGHLRVGTMDNFCDTCIVLHNICFCFALV